MQILNSTLDSNGGRITVDRNGSNGNAMTVLINASTLNASHVDGTAGDITLKAWNPNINLSAPAYVNSVRNGAAMLQVSGGSQLTGNNILLETTLSGANAVGLPVFINGATLTALQDITLKGLAGDGAAPVQTELRGAGNALNAGGNVTIDGPAGIILNGNISAGNDIGLSADNGGIRIENGGSLVSANGNITLDGTS
ncbi:hypothetical protein GFI45_26030, partial [Salmonella enterica subsp. enterica]|nr:hypothetical protein [Salmonella enterica subsp. enterica serovar Vitkin]